MEETEETISKAAHLKRLASKQAKIDELSAQLTDSKKAATDLEAQLKALNPEKAERRIAKLMQERDSAREALANLETRHSTERALLTVGITDQEDQELVNWRYSRLPEDSRPDLASWLEGDAKEDRHLSHLFKQSETAEPPKRAGLPRANNGTRTQEKPPNSGSLEAFLAMPASERVKPENQAHFNQLLALEG